MNAFLTLLSPRFIGSLAVLFATVVATTMFAEARDGADDSSVKPTIDRALNFLAKDALAWKAEHDCSSCHHAAMVVWAMNEAKLRDYTVNEDVLTDMTQWLTKAGEGKTSLPRPESAPRALNTKPIYYALGLGSIPKPTKDEKEAMARLLTTVKGDQIENGSWVAWPETRPPIFGPSNETMTALATLSLIGGSANGIGFAKETADRGISWLSTQKSDGDAQSLALRLILATRLNRPTNELASLAKQISDRQNADGGWSQTADTSSDAWATGQALYALAHARVSATKEAVLRGRNFLVRTQSAEGSWPMKSRPTKPGEAGAKNLIPITGAAAAWAVMGLVRSDPLTGQ